MTRLLKKEGVDVDSVDIDSVIKPLAEELVLQLDEANQDRFWDGQDVAELTAVHWVLQRTELGFALTRTNGAPARPSKGADVTPPRSATVAVRVKVADETLENGLSDARRENRLLAVVFTDPDEGAREEQTALLLEGLRARGMDQLAERFLWIRRPVCDHMGLPTPEAQAHRARKSPTLTLFDPWADVPTGQRFPSLVTQEDPKQLRGALERAMLEAARAGHPPRPGQR